MILFLYLNVFFFLNFQLLFLDLGVNAVLSHYFLDLRSLLYFVVNLILSSLVELLFYSINFLSLFKSFLLELVVFLLLAFYSINVYSNIPQFKANYLPYIYSNLTFFSYIIFILYYLCYYVSASIYSYSLFFYSSA